MVAVDDVDLRFCAFCNSLGIVNCITNAWTVIAQQSAVQTVQDNGALLVIVIDRVVLTLI